MTYQQKQATLQPMETDIEPGPLPFQEHCTIALPFITVPDEDSAYALQVAPNCDSAMLPQGIENLEGKRVIEIPVFESMTHYLMSKEGADKRLTLYSFLNDLLRKGRLSGIVGFQVLNRVINRQVCDFTDFRYWELDRQEFIADISVTLTLKSKEGTREWKGVLVCYCGFTHQFYMTVEELVRHLDDDGVIAHASASASGDKFKALYDGHWEEGYDSQSDADMAFVSMLCFWCGNVEEQIDRIFRSSGLMRDKWDRMTGDRTYGQITIRNAIASTSEIYTPIADFSAEDDFEDIEGETDTEQLMFEPDFTHITLTLEQMQPHTNPRYQRDEIGIGYAFADFYKPIARFNRERGIWYVYDGAVWRPDENALAVAELAKKLADRLYTFALQIKDEDTRNRYIKRVQKLQLRKNRRTMIEDAKSVYPVSHGLFDHNTDLFNCKNGTLNLTTGEFKPHDPADFLTMMSGITYDPKATCPRWEQFISEVMCSDADLALYLQKALGYALTGDTSLECLFILYGATSRNGKGTTMETFLQIVGDYGKTSNPEMLSTKFGNTNASGPSEEIARLAGIRFVNISEPEKKITFNAALVKRMTGNDTLNARFLHENSFDFKPNFKIFINTNYKPSVSDMTLFYSCRLKLIPFKRHFEEHEQDKGLKSFFAEETNLSAIFNWCYEGYKRFRAEGLEDPAAVTTATKEYEAESDRVGQFVDAWLEEGEAFEERTSAVYRLYGQWCDKYGYRKENSTNFNNAIQRFFSIVRKRPSDGSGGPTTMLVGCRFLKHENGEQDHAATEDEGAFS